MPLLWVRLFHSVRQEIKLDTAAVRGSGHVLRVRGHGADYTGKLDVTTISSKLRYSGLSV